MKGRKQFQTRSKPEQASSSGNSVSGSCNPADAASGPEAGRAGIRPGHGTLEPVAPMPRGRQKGGNGRGLSTDAGHRDGTTRSSVEGPVMGLEPRGRVILSLGTGQFRVIGRGILD